MELKRVGERIEAVIRFPFNRTSMELKLTLPEVADRYLPAFNRTSMELKPMPISDDDDFFAALLIEPVWN